MPEALLWLLLTGDVPTKAQVRERETETERQAARQGLGLVTSRERERDICHYDRATTRSQDMWKNTTNSDNRRPAARSLDRVVDVCA